MEQDKRNYKSYKFPINIKNLREEIITLIKNYAGEGSNKFVDKLVALFKQQMKEIIGGMEEIELEKTDKEMNLEKEVGHKIDYSNQKEFIRNKLRKELLKNIEEL